MTTDPEPNAGPGPLDPRKILQQAIAGEDADAAASGWQPPRVDELAARFPELEIVELIGRGGMGAVYRAVQRKLARAVALKVLPPELAKDPAFEERFLREARALATLEHPRILTVHDFGERDGLFYLVTEFVEGMNLRQLMDMGELSPAEALRIAPQVCEALQYAHDRGVVHRDIKPENLLVDRSGDVKIADFGLARIVDDGQPSPALTRSTQIVGTPHYMAPEQWRHGVPVDHRADIYSVGVVLYEMLTGQLPLGHFEPPSRRGDVPRRLDDVVRKSLAQSPEQRYQRASEVGQDLVRCRTAPTPGRSHGGRRRRVYHVAGPNRSSPARILATAWIFAIVAFVGGVIYVESNRHRMMEYQMSQARSQDLRREAQMWAIRNGREHERDVLGSYLREIEVPAWERRRDEAAQSGAAFTDPKPSYPAPIDASGSPQALWTQLGGLAFLGAVLFSFCGFAAVARIRQRRQGAAGLGLALLTAWGPTLALLIVIPVSVLNSNLRDPDTAVLAATIVALVLAIAAIVWLSWQFRRIAAQAEPAADADADADADAA